MLSSGPHPVLRPRRFQVSTMSRMSSRLVGLGVGSGVVRHLLVDRDVGVRDPDRAHADLLGAVDVLEGAVADVDGALRRGTPKASAACAKISACGFTHVHLARSRRRRRAGGARRRARRPRGGSRGSQIVLDSTPTRIARAQRSHSGPTWRWCEGVGLPEHAGRPRCLGPVVLVGDAARLEDLGERRARACAGRASRRSSAWWSRQRASRGPRRACPTRGRALVGEGGHCSRKVDLVPRRHGATPVEDDRLTAGCPAVTGGPAGLGDARTRRAPTRRRSTATSRRSPERRSLISTCPRRGRGRRRRWSAPRSARSP